MKSLRSIIAIAALALTVPAQAGTGDPEVVIYRVSGVNDNGGAANTGSATAIHCTNFSGVSENVRFVVRASNAAILANLPLTVAHLNTATVTTKAGFFYAAATLLNTGAVQQGTVAIAATSVNVTCTAMQFDAGATGANGPQAVALHMTRFNPVPGTQE